MIGQKRPERGIKVVEITIQKWIPKRTGLDPNFLRPSLYCALNRLTVYLGRQSPPLQLPLHMAGFVVAHVSEN